MARYIDADALLENLKLQYGEELGWQCIVNMSDVGMMIEDAPTADVAPRAEWISAENSPDEYRDEYGELIPFLVCCQGTVYPFRAMYDGANWGDGIGVLNVTHWMPLPEPPKGE